MKKSYRKAFASLAAAVMILGSGCAKRELVVPQTIAIEPDFSIKENIQIDWFQVEDECYELLNAEEYPLVDQIDYVVFENEKIIRLILVLKNEANQIDALTYGAKYIKAFNDAIATQDFSVARSGEDYYGGLWDEYGLELEVYPLNEILSEDTSGYYVNQKMDPGANDPVVPLIHTQQENVAESAAQ
ncbi:MAG: hypothetical protein Q4A19_00245 [Johnsonella sp.]|nr:hypothetical protein [Johnsonella sp.]